MIRVKNLLGTVYVDEDLGFELQPGVETEISLMFSPSEISFSDSLKVAVSNGSIQIGNALGWLSIPHGLSHINLETEYEDDTEDQMAEVNQTNESKNFAIAMAIALG